VADVPSRLLLVRPRYGRALDLEHADVRARSHRDAGPGIEPRLVRLDRPDAGVVCAYRPIADALGARTTLAGAGVLGLFTFAFLFIPGVRDPERIPLPDGKARLGSVS
jgi:hypothetical protein